MGDLAFVKPERRALFERHQQQGRDYDLRAHINRFFYEAVINGDSKALMRLLTRMDPGVDPQA